MLKVGHKKSFLVLIVALFPAIVALAQPTIISTPPDEGTYGAAYSYDIITDSWPTPGNLRITLLSGAPGMQVEDNQDGTALLSGTLTAAGQFAVSIEVKDIVTEQVSTQDFNVDVAKAVLTVFADDKTKSYGTVAGFTFSYAGFVNGDNVGSLATLPTATSTGAAANGTAGTHTIVPANAVDENYDFNYVNGTLTVNKVILKITADDKSKVYGADLPEFTLSYEGFVAGDTPSAIENPPTISTLATAGSNVNTYAISLASGTDENYDFTRVNGTLTITKATVTVTADNFSRNYAVANPSTFNITYGPFVNGDTQAVLDVKPTAATSATSTSNAGTYPVIPSGGADNNYNFSYVNGTLTINKLALTITADPKSRPYGASNPTFTFAYSGFATGENSSVLPTLPTATSAAPTADVGTYPIVPGGAASPNYTFTYVNGVLTINKVALTITADAQSKVYGAALPTLTFSYSGFISGENSSVIENPPTISTTATAASNVGNYTISLSGGSDTNYSFTLVNGNLAVTKAVVTATADNKTRVYAGANPSFTITYTGFVNGDNETALNTPGPKPTATTTAGTGTAAGTYDITVSGGNDDNYTFAYVSGALTITKATVTVTADAKSRAYGAANPTLTYVYSGFLNGDVAAGIDTPPTGTTTATEASHIGTYPITLGSGVDNNYNFTYVGNNLTITKAPLTITAQPQSRPYGSANPELTLAYTGFQNGDTPSVFLTAPTVSTTATPTSNASTYTITVSGATASDYTITHVNGTLTVTKAPLTVTADDKTRIYGGGNPPFTLVYDGFVNGQTVANISPAGVSTTASLGSDVGTYPIIPSGASSANYSFVYVNGTLTITQATVTATAVNASRSYGAADPTFTITYTGFRPGQNESVLLSQPTASTAATITSDVGTYPITVTGGSALNYTLAYVPGVLTINKATITATADPKTRSYGVANPTFTVSYTGFKNGQDASVINTPPNATTTATATSNAGNYTISVSGGNDDNYTFSYTSGTLTITKAVLLATADNKARAYGAANPTFTVTYTGLLGTDVPGDILTAPSMTTPAVGTSTVGNYAINIAGGTDENYTFNYAAGTLSIGKATLTAKPDAKSRVYGAANPVFTTSYTGFANGETASVIDAPAMASTTATATSDVGTYSITANGASDNNYDFVYNTGTLTITKATLTITANNQTRAYGAANPAFTLSYSGFLNGDTPAALDAPAPSASTVATVASPAGNYVINISNGTDNNYTYSFVAGTLSVTKASLTITADNKTRVYNTANPAFTLSYTGFLNGDTPASITPPAASTSATLASSVGDYPISLAGGSSPNYAYTLVPGTLTITKATPVITWNNPSAISYGTPLGASQLNASSNVGGSFDYTPGSGTILNAGAGQVLKADFTPSDLTNYNTVFGTTVTITVNKATPVITWANPAPITYGTTLNAINQLNATTSAPGSFTYTPGVGTLLNAGANQVLKADFHTSDPANYNDVLNIQRTITVNKATPVVTWSNPAAITYGTPLTATQLNATFSVGGNPTYLPGAGTILPTGANQPISVNFTPDDGANYNSIVGYQVLITVIKATPVITWTSPGNITYGTALNTTDHLNPTHNVAGSFTFNPPAGTVLAAGNGQTLTASFTPSDPGNYNSVTNITTTINVIKADPVITWAALSPITYGTALSSTQLGATASVGGGYSYSPGSGTVLNAGPNQTITLTFTPTDQANYNTIVVNRSLTVNKATPVVTWPAPAQITYGTPLSSTQQNAVGSVPGVTIYTPAPGTILNTGVNQTLSVRFEPNDANNYNVVPATTTQITVVKATPVVTWATPLPIKVGVALSSTQLNATANVPGQTDYTPDFGSSFAVEGTYTLHVKFTPTDQTNYHIVPDTHVQIVVSSKDNPVITWNDPAAITYGTVLTATQNGALASVPGTYDYVPATGTKMNAGTNQNLTVTFTPTDQVNYNIVSKTVHINVNKATLTATAVNANRVYGAANPSFNVNYSGFISGDNATMIDTPPTMTCAAIAGDPAGSTFPIVPSGGSDNNYQFTYVNGTLTINKAPLTATADNKTRAYGISNPGFTISYTGFANGDNQSNIVQPTASTSALITSNVGTYPITLAGGSASNYNITLVAGSLSITQALLVVLGDDLTRLYGQANPALTYKYVGFKNGDTESSIGTPPNATTTATAASPVGVYTVNITGGSSVNYSLATFAGSLTVNKAGLTIKAVDKSRPYGSSNPSNTMSFTGFVNGDDSGDITLPTFSGPSATVTSDVGSYPIQLSGGSATNYDITLQNGALSVTKAVLTAKANNATRVYGEPNPLFTINYTGFLNGDDVGDITPPTASTAATSTSNAGSYPITLAGGTATNYSFTLQPGTLTVTPASLIAKAADRTRTYGFVNPINFTIDYTGFLNGDDASDITPPTGSSTGTGTSNVGTYPITLTGGSAINYTLTLQPGTLTIQKANLTATADNKTKVYGTANPANSITYTGFRNSDNAGNITPPSITGPNATASSPVGSYPITLAGGSATNYNITTVNGELTITKAPLSAKADNKSRVYGAADPAFTITYTGFVAGDNSSTITKPVASTTATATSNVGNYPIDLTGTTANYDFTFTSGTLSITKAPATIVAENKERVYGIANPSLTVAYSGLVNNETASVIDTPPTVATTALITTGVSTVPITVSGAVDNNYDFTYVAGSLSITKAPLTAKADNKSKAYGSANPANTITYTGFMNNETASVITQPTIATSATATSPVGTYPITLTGGSANNYLITLVNGTLTVTPAIITVKASNQNRTYGGNNPALTLTYTGFVSGQGLPDIDILPTAATTATVTSAVGTYPITASGGADTNYGFAYTPGTLTIDKATLTATADTKATTYGTIPPLTISYTGFMNGESASVIDTPPTAATTATVTSELGTYPISLTGGADNNYNLVNVAGNVTIGKAPLTARAEDKSRIIGLPNPDFTIAYSGFVNTDAISDINTLPTATTVANLASVPGIYPITVAGGNDDHYEFVYQAGSLTVVLDNPPVVKNFQVEADEDTSFPFSLNLFATNYTDDPNGKIIYIKITSLPLNGTLFRGASRVVVNEELPVTNNQLPELSYMPNSNYAGNDAFGWNLFDGSFLALANATVTIKVRPVNDPPVLSNIESNSILYSLGDPAVPITGQLIINDVDDNFIFSASVRIASNLTNGDELSVEGGVGTTEIEASYDAAGGELKLTGKDTRTNYETILKKVKFSSGVSGEATISEKNIAVVVRDSVANSNIASRKIQITEVFPELDIVNAFTPNGDDVNDFWDIVNLDSYSDILITVFNRDGTKVFTCTSQDCKWDGRANGELQPAGPYSYIIDLNNGKRRYRGTVTVLR